MTRGTGARRRVLTVGAIAVASATAVTTMPAVALGADSAVTPVVQDLVGPRGVWADASGRAIFAEADGTVTLKTKGAQTTLLTTVPATGIAPAVTRQRGRIFILTTGGEPGSGATLYRYGNRSGQAKPVADIAAYQVGDPDPYNLEGVPEESNPFGVAALNDGTVLVADAAGNDLLRVYPNGDIETVAVLKPRVVEAPPEFAADQTLPPPGTPIPAEAVTTSVAVGADGY